MHLSGYDQVRKQREENAFVYFLDFVEGCEGKHTSTIYLRCVSLLVLPLSVVHVPKTLICIIQPEILAKNKF